LPIDTILYPQSSREQVGLAVDGKPLKKSKLKKQMTQHMIESIDGLKGYEVAGQKVFQVMA
jgi:hypothetical protein